MLKRIIYFLFISAMIASCAKEENNFILPEFDPDVEIAEGVESIYSDSAKIKFIIRTPRKEEYYEQNVLVMRFPKGVNIEFYDREQKISSTMYAKYAERRSSKGTFLLRDSVVLTNAENDELTTTGIIWNEIEQTLSTNKFVRLVKAGSQDTLYGVGLDAKDDFSRMNIKNLQAKRRSESNSTP